MRLKAYAKRFLRLLEKAERSSGLGDFSVSSYWTQRNVTMHHKFTSAQDSLDYLRWRNDQYFGYAKLMPVEGQDGKAVLDYGCGPGHDLVGFGVFSKPGRLAGAEVSPSSLSEASERLRLHNIDAELVLLSQDAERLPFEDASFDHIHSSGVLHHTPDPVKIMKEFRRILKPGGTVNIMVYNYDSVWLHLYVAYRRTLLDGLYADLDLRGRFAKSTDGDSCPIANCYKPSEWMALCSQAGFSAKFIGASVSVFEASLLPSRFDAIQDRRLPAECREFLIELELDKFGLPLYRGVYAGVDACFQLT